MIKQVIVMRKDLNMRKGKMAAQAAHASMKVFLDRSHWNGGDQLVIDLWEEAEVWVKGTFTKVCVGCDSEVELRGLHQKALDAGLKVALIEDSGATEFHGVKTATCIAIGPHEASKIDAITGHLKLL